MALGTCRDDRTIACIFADSNSYWVLNIPAFFLGASASNESIKVAEIASSTSQIKMATLKEALKNFGVSRNFSCLGMIRRFF